VNPWLVEGAAALAAAAAVLVVFAWFWRLALLPRQRVRHRAARTVARALHQPAPRPETAAAHHLIQIRQWDRRRIVRATVPYHPDHHRDLEKAWADEFTPTDPQGRPLHHWDWIWHPERHYGDVRRRPPIPDTSSPAAPLPTEGGTIADCPQGALRLGQGRHGPVHWLTGRHPHLAIAGRTGAGKTAALHTVIRAAIAAGWTVVAVDPKRFELLGFEGHPGVLRVARTDSDMLHAVTAVTTELHRRAQLLEKTRRRGDPDPPFTPWLLVVDEVTELVQATGGRKSPAVADLGTLMRLGRALAIHVAVATQRPDVAEALPGSIRDQADARLGLGRLGPAGARMLYDDAAIDLPEGSPTGRAVLMAGGTPHETQIDYSPPPTPLTPGFEQECAEFGCHDPDPATPNTAGLFRKVGP
jgi:hypothetical protein